MTALQYYYWLRNHHGYSKENAYLSTLMNYCCSLDEVSQRYKKRISQ